MNKKDYKGYELVKAIHNREIKDGTKIEVHSLKVLDNIIAVIEYSNKRLEWGTGEFDTSYLFDDDYYFRVLEDNTKEIEEFKGETFEQLGYEVGKLSMAIAKGFEKAIKELGKDNINE